MKKVFCIVLALMLLACEKQTVDALAFPSVSLDNYEFENYDDPEIEVPAQYTDNLEQHLVPLSSFNSVSGETHNIYGLYLGDTTTIDQDTVIYFLHGQARHMDFYWTRAALWANLGGKHNFGVFMIDYRGYGMSEGTSSELGLSEDANAGIDWLIEKGLTEDRCIYYGFSLGAIPLIERTANRTDFSPLKLICESPLASVEYLTQSSTVINADADFVTELEFENAEMIKKVNVPYLWIHGENDNYISIDNGEIIYNNYQGAFKQSIRVPLADHADVPVILGFENYLNGILQFIRT